MQVQHLPTATPHLFVIQSFTGKFQTKTKKLFCWQTDQDLIFFFFFLDIQEEQERDLEKEGVSKDEDGWENKPEERGRDIPQTESENIFSKDDRKCPPHL